jgi:hypothetical protein
MMVVGYLIQVESDAYSIADDRHAYERGWDYGCDYRVLYKFEESDSLNDMRQDPYMDEWGRSAVTSSAGCMQFLRTYVPQPPSPICEGSS